MSNTASATCTKYNSCDINCTQSIDDNITNGSNSYDTDAQTKTTYA